VISKGMHTLALRK